MLVLLHNHASLIISGISLNRVHRDQANVRCQLFAQQLDTYTQVLHLTPCLSRGKHAFTSFYLFCLLFCRLFYRLFSVFCRRLSLAAWQCPLRRRAI